jgi:hypothetical protein
MTQATRTEAEQGATTTAPAEKTMPVQVFRLRGVKVAVFENKPRDGGAQPWFKLTAQKIYREGNAFKTTTSFGRDDVPVLQHLLHEAWVWVLRTEADRARAPKEGE